MDVAEFTQRLREQRMNVASQMQTYLDSIHAEKREMSAEEHQTWKRYNERLDEIDDQVKTAVDTERRTRDDAAFRESNERQYGTGSYMDERREGDLIRSFLRGEPGNWDRSPDSGRPCMVVPIARAAKEVAALRSGATAMEARNLAWDTGSAGSLVPTTLARSLYQYMEASISMWRAPTTKVQTSSGEPMQFPTLAAHAIGTHVIAQGTAIGGTDPTFARVQLDAFKYGQLVGIANEVVADSAVDVASFIGKDMGRSLGRLMDADFVVGTGTGQPRGVMVALNGNGAGSVTTGGSLIAPTYEKWVDTVYALTDEYRNMGAAGWLMKDSTVGNIRKIRSDGGGTIGPAMWVPSVTQGLAGGQPDHFLGYPVYSDVNIASLGSNARAAAFMDFSAYYIRTVGDIVVELDTSYAFNADMTYARAKIRADGDLLDYSAGVTIVQNV